MINIPQPNRIL